MRQDGVEVRGITQPDGTAEFCEVFFTDARCPKDNVVGGVNNGWKVANSTLAFERGQSATTGYRRFEDEYKLLVEQAAANGRIADPVIRQRLTRYYTKVQMLRINGLRSLSATLSGAKDPGVAALGATNKMFWSEMHKEAMELALDVFGVVVDARRDGTDGGLVARRGARQAARPATRQPDESRVLLQPQRDDLGRHQPDPAQHRRRARARPPQRAVVITTVSV